MWTDDETEDPDVQWTSGNYEIDAKGEVDLTGGTTDTDSVGSGPHLKSSLPLIPPDVPIPAASGSSSQYANALVGNTDMLYRAEGLGTAYLSDFLINEYELSVHTWADCGKGCDNSRADAKIDDPFIMTWTDSDPHTIVFHASMEAGTRVEPGSTVIWRSDLDFGNDGLVDQLFFRVEMGTETNYPDPVDLVLGPGVFLEPGLTEAEIEADLAAMAGMDAWELLADYPLEFRYTVSTGAPGELAVTLDGAATSEVGRGTSKSPAALGSEQRKPPHSNQGAVGGVVEVLFNDFQDGGDLPSMNGWTSHDLSGHDVGDFAKVWPFLIGADACADNATPVLAFIDDGLVLPGTGGSICSTACYGPTGWVVNTTGGLSDTDAHLHNVARSPIMPWPDSQFEGATLSFDVYCDAPIGDGAAGAYPVWSIRSTDDPAGLSGWTAWSDRGRVYHGEPGWYAISEDVTDLLVPGRTWVQVQVGVRELGYLWGDDGNDATPAPYFDNVSLYARPVQGPALVARVEDIAEDAFPSLGTVDYGDLSANAISLVAAESEEGHVVICEAVPVRSGAVLAYVPRLHYKLSANPLFDPVRTSGWPNEGTVTSPDSLQAGGWGYSLPSTGFFFPGDVIHFYVEAADDLGGVISTSIVPADTTGYAGGHAQSLGYPEAWRVRGLPSVASVTPGDQPPILLWCGDGAQSDLVEWSMALQNLGFEFGNDVDLLYSKSAGDPDFVVINRTASGPALDDYTTILYAAGNGSPGITDADASELVTWLGSGNRNLLLAGGHLASHLSVSGASAQSLVDVWASVSVQSSELRPLVSNQSAVGAVSIAGNGVFGAMDWVVYGSCASPASFDALVPFGAAVRLAEFTDPQGNGGAYPLAAITLHEDAGSGSQVVLMPASLGSIRTSTQASRAAIPVVPRAALLSDILAQFGHTASGAPTGAPQRTPFQVSVSPNPFNPATRIQFVLPEEGRIKIDIYNVRGESVRSLLDAVHPAGAGEVVWRGMDNAGQSVASGVYFFHARVGGHEKVGKIALVR